MKLQSNQSQKEKEEWNKEKSKVMRKAHELGIQKWNTIPKQFNGIVTLFLPQQKCIPPAFFFWWRKATTNSGIYNIFLQTIMAESCVDVGVSLASHTSFPFHPMVGWIHLASLQTSSHHLLHACLVILVSPQWISNHHQDGAYYTCGFSPSLPSVDRQNNIIGGV